MSITDFSREPAKLADINEAVIFGEGNSINGRQLLQLRNAMDDLRGMGPAATKRKAAMQAEAKREGLFSVQVVVRNLSFSDVHAFIQPGDCPDMEAAGEQVLTVYYAPLQDEEGPYIELRAIAPAAPLVIAGEGRDLVIGAGVDIFEDLVKDRLDEIKGKVRERIDLEKGEARVDVAMAEAA